MPPGKTDPDADSEGWCQQLLEQALDAVIGVDENDRVIAWNRQAEITFGWRRDEVIGQPMSKLIVPPEHRAAHAHGVARFLRTGVEHISNRRIELQALRRDGSRFPVELTVIPVRVQGRYRFYSFLRDMTEHVRTLQELQLKSEALENSLNGFDIVDAKGRIVYANSAYLQMWGYDSLDEIYGTSPAGHCADPEMAGRIIAALREHGETDVEFLARRKDGSTFLVRMWARVGQDANGNEIYPSTSIDITEHRRAEEELRYQRDLVRTITDNAASCLFMMDDRGHPTFMNPAAMEVTGYRSLEEIANRPLHEAIHWKRPDGSPYPMAECPIDNAQAALEPVQNQEEMFCTKQGDLFPVSYSLTPLEKSGQVVGSVLEFRDISEQRRVRWQLEEAVRARDEFISICSHELKTPLTSMMMLFQIARRQLRSGDERVFEREAVTRRVESVNRQLERMARLIDDMLDVSRISPGTMKTDRESLDLCEFAHDVMARFSEELAAAPATVLCELRRVWVRADRHRLEQVLSNLVTNAMKYGSGKPIRVEVSAVGGRARLTVRDEGIGIATDDLERIFDRFQRAVPASSISGLGLGLYISRKIIEAHDGRIWAESERGRGATLHVELPLDDPPSGSRPSPP